MSDFDPPRVPGQHGQPSGTPGQGDSPWYPAGSSYPGAGEQSGYPGAGEYPGYPGAGEQSGYPGTGEYPGYPGAGQPGYHGTGEWQPGWNPPTAQWHSPYQNQYQQYPGYQPGPPYQPAPRHRPLRTVLVLLSAVGLAVLVGVGLGRFAWQPGQNNLGSNSPLSGSSNGSGGSSGGPASTSLDPAAIAAKVDPGLVDVNTVLGYQGAEAAGTGIVLTSNGEVLTNNHVVEGATSIQVTDIGNGKTYKATVDGYDRTQDIAVLRLQDATGLSTVSIGDSSKLAVGDAVVGIGNAGGAGGMPSTAAGTVTALNQSITASDGSNSSSEQLSGLIQVNANIQSGDSGGSLVNGSAQVIGVDTAASSGYQFQGGQGGGQGQAGGHEGFAIPINQALTIARQIEAGKASTTVHIGKSAFLGVSVADAGGQGQNGQGQNGQGQGQGGSGAMIRQLLQGSPLSQAGITAGDVITSLGGQNVDSATTLTNLMDQHHPGDQLSLTWLDQAGQQHTATISPITGPVG